MAEVDSGKLRQLAEDHAAALERDLRELGADAPTVIVAVASDGEHSTYWTQYRGSYLRLEGLALLVQRAVEAGGRSAPDDVDGV
ncbi:MAG: hypothetical protein ACJ79H_17520 [Myxococcales bacterium]